MSYLEVFLPPQDHGVCHVGDLELVKAQNIPVLRDICSYKRHSVYVVPVLHLHAVQPPVYVLHEVVVVYPRF